MWRVRFRRRRYRNRRRMKTYSADPFTNVCLTTRLAVYYALEPDRSTSACFYATTNPHASSATRYHSSGVHSPRTPSSEVMYLRQPCAHNKTSGFTTLARSQRFTAHQAGQRRLRHQPMSSYDSRALHSDFQEFTLPFTWCSSHPDPTAKIKTDQTSRGVSGSAIWK